MAKSTSKKTVQKKAPKTTPEQQPQLQELFLDSIKDIYWAEKHLSKALPKMEKGATSEELQNAFADHTVATQEHISRLEQVFELMGEKAQAKKCDAMEGLVKEGQSIMEDTEEGTATRDVGLILAAQKVEHYEIATYGGLAQLATTLGLDEITALTGANIN
ncbi:ferritin-like domain-containing protein [soil metagenome]